MVQKKYQHEVEELQKKRSDGIEESSEHLEEELLFHDEPDVPIVDKRVKHVDIEVERESSVSSRYSRVSSSSSSSSSSLSSSSSSTSSLSSGMDWMSGSERERRMSEDEQASYDKWLHEKKARKHRAHGVEEDILRHENEQRRRQKLSAKDSSSGHETSSEPTSSEQHLSAKKDIETQSQESGRFDLDSQQEHHEEEYKIPVYHEHEHPKFAVYSDEEEQELDI